MATFTVATTDYVDGAERSEYHAIVAWDRLAEIAARYLVKQQLDLGLPGDHELGWTAMSHA